MTEVAITDPNVGPNTWAKREVDQNGEPLQRTLMSTDEASLTAENTFTDEIPLRGLFSISIADVSDSTITIQRTFDDGVTWHDIKQYTADAQENGFALQTLKGGEDNEVRWRLGIKTGDYGSDTVLCRIWQ